MIDTIIGNQQNNFTHVTPTPSMTTTIVSSNNSNSDIDQKIHEMAKMLKDHDAILKALRQDVNN